MPNLHSMRVEVDTATFLQVNLTIKNFSGPAGAGLDCFLVSSCLRLLLCLLYSFSFLSDCSLSFSAVVSCPSLWVSAVLGFFFPKPLAVFTSCCLLQWCFDDSSCSSTVPRKGCSSAPWAPVHDQNMLMHIKKSPMGYTCN